MDSADLYQTIPTRELSDGTALPVIGLGTFSPDDTDVTAMVTSGIDNGYRLIDTALRYENEPEVGAAIAASDVDRNDILITTKIPGRLQGYDGAIESARTSMANLGVDHIDLLLIHWPLPRLDKYVDTWRAMIDMRRDGLVTSIGVCNFEPAHLDRISGETGVMPVVNQIEMHPFFPQRKLREFHARNGIATEAWSPFGRGSAIMECEPVTSAATAHNVSPGQVIIRWHHQLDAVPLPKSAHSERQRENRDIFGFALTDEEMAAISALERGRIQDQDPNTYEEF